MQGWRSANAFSFLKFYGRGSASSVDGSSAMKPSCCPPPKMPLIQLNDTGLRASISARLKIEPVLLEYQEPGVVYSLGHPIATTRDRDGFFAHLVGGKSVLTVALPSEVEVMRSHFGLFVTPVDQVEGFIISKGKKQTLQLAVVRENNQSIAEPALGANARRVGLKLENTLVK